MRFAEKSLICAFATTLVLAGCVTTEGDQSNTLRGAESPAYSLDSSQKEMTVAVSPARQTFQIGGLTTGLIGAGISAISDARHRKAVKEALDGYDAGAIFEQHLTQRLEETMDSNIARVAPMGSAAGYKQRREAEMDRFRAVGRDHDLLLDLDMTYGLYGFEGTLITKLEAELNETPNGSPLWRNTYVVSSQPLFAGDKLTDPTQRVMANYTSPRFTVAEGAIEKWTADGGEILRTRYEQAVAGVTSALLTDLGLVDEAVGHYFLGQHHMNKKEFEEAAEHFTRAMELDPGYIEARNGLAVNAAHAGQIEDALRIEREIVEQAPEYAPAHMNLAWLLVETNNNAEAARPHYEKALALGMWPEKKIDKALGRQ